MATNSTFDRRVLLWQYAPVVFWIGVIFYLSTDQGSMSQTSRFIRPLLEFLFPPPSEQTPLIYHRYIRKAAHFTEYAVLAFLAVRALSIPATVWLHKWRYILPLLLVAGVAVIDEFNQSFEVSRTGSIQDVLLDISGGVVDDHNAFPTKITQHQTSINFSLSVADNNGQRSITSAGWGDECRPCVWLDANVHPLSPKR